MTIRHVLFWRGEYCLSIAACFAAVFRNSGVAIGKNGAAIHKFLRKSMVLEIVNVRIPKNGMRTF